jgi:hypothetical protein
MNRDILPYVPGLINCPKLFTGLLHVYMDFNGLTRIMQLLHPKLGFSELYQRVKILNF